MPPSAGDGDELLMARRAIVVVDVVESVVHMREDELGFVRRWRHYVGGVRDAVLPRWNARLVKSLGDGLLVECPTVPSAARCGLDMLELMQRQQQTGTAQRPIGLRIGAHITDVVVDDLDVYGSGVNLAARLAALGKPGAMIISTEFRDGLVDGLDARIEDLGDCHLKHFEQPIRAFRVRRSADESPDSLPAMPLGGPPAIAVLPFDHAPGRDDHRFLGDALADDVIAGLSSSKSLRVISRLSSLAFRGGEPELKSVRASLGVSYVATGRCRADGSGVRLQVQLTDARDGHVVWSESFRMKIDADLEASDEAVSTIVGAIHAEIVDRELHRTRTLPFRQLDDYGLYFGGMSLLYRSTRSDFDRARSVFEQLASRQPRLPTPPALAARWHLFRLMQGWSAAGVDDERLARELARRAVDLDERSSLGLAVDGLLTAHIDGDLDVARRRSEAAVEADAQDPYAWMVHSGVLSYRGQGIGAVEAAERAMRLSPLDPAGYQYQAYLAMACLCAGQHARAIELAEASMLRNKTMTASWRIKIIAQVLSGRMAEARDAARSMLQLQPGYTVSQYMRRYPGRNSAHAAEYARALAESGIPN